MAGSSIGRALDAAAAGDVSTPRAGGYRPRPIGLEDLPEAVLERIVTAACARVPADCDGRQRHDPWLPRAPRWLREVSRDWRRRIDARPEWCAPLLAERIGRSADATGRGARLRRIAASRLGPALAIVDTLEPPETPARGPARGPIPSGRGLCVESAAELEMLADLAPGLGTCHLHAYRDLNMLDLAPLTALRQLRHLTVEGNGIVREAMLRDFTRLQSLRVECPLEGQETYVELPPTLVALTSLHLHAVAVTATTLRGLAALTALRALNVMDFHYLSDDSGIGTALPDLRVAAYLAPLTRLTFLRMACSDQWTRADYRTLAGLPHLRALELTDATTLHDASLAPVLSTGRLEALHVECAEDLLGTGLGDGAPATSRLGRLGLVDCPRLASLGWAAGAPLRTLIVARCPALPAAALNALARGPTLRRVVARSVAECEASSESHEAIMAALEAADAEGLGAAPP